VEKDGSANRKGLRMARGIPLLYKVTPISSGGEKSRHHETEQPTGNAKKSARKERL